jgi:histidine ammonia-lyase
MRLAITADVIGAMSLDAMLGTGAAFDERLVAARPHPGQVVAARHLRELLRDSEIWASHRADREHRVQDAYSLRCMPQVHGAARDVFAELERVLRVEINAATDNPLVFASGEVISGGNFHGEPLALALDYATMAIAELASISERRTARLVDPHLNGGLPAFLTEQPGMESGLMIAHYTAAALVNELQGLSHPASVDTIPTSANQEDHVSMGATSALLLRDAIDRTATVLAVEALCAARGLDLRYPQAPGRGVQAAVAVVRAAVPPLDGDRSPSPDIAALAEAILAGRLAAVASA